MRRWVSWRLRKAGCCIHGPPSMPTGRQNGGLDPLRSDSKAAHPHTRVTAPPSSCPSAHSGDSPTVLPEFLPRPHEARGIGLSDDGDHTAQLSVPLRCTPLLGLASCLIWRGNDAGHLTSESPVPPTGPCRAHHDGLMAQTHVSINLHS